MDDPNILDLDPLVLLDIETVLQNKSTRESFLKVIPPDIFNYTSIQLMDNEAYKYHMNHARWLLWHLSSKAVRASEFCYWLGKANLQKALVVLKRDVPIQIIEQPPPIVCVQKGSELFLSIQASSFPLPEFQWFKNGNELLSHQDSDLFIPEAKIEDAGFYHCLITKSNIQTNDISWNNTNIIQVIVLEDTFPETSNCEALGSSHATVTCKYISDEITNPDFNYSNQNNASENEENEAAKIEFTRHPCVQGVIAQGMSVSLHCEAKCVSSTGQNIPLKYQWYKNRKILEGATSQELHLKDLCPDLESGDMEWEYFCGVSTERDRLNRYRQMSRSAVVKLASADSTTPYYASGKYAFMIANDSYDKLKELKTPANDVSVIGKKLQALDFKVFAYKNLTLTQMKNAFNQFCKLLDKNCYVLFYFAGHGFEQVQMYLQPVDCTDSYKTKESISVDYILEKLQETVPALNVLLIDACRNLPPSQSDVVKLDNTSQGLIKNNTIYGYSTPKFYSSHESDSEPYSFFVKYLEKNITPGKCIQEILRQVQRDFESDPMVKGVQFPVITTSLTGDRKLCDKINGNRKLKTSETFMEYIKGCNPNSFEIPYIKSTILLETTAHLDIFINEIDITVYITTKENIPERMCKILQALEINLVSETPGVKILPSTGCHLRDVPLKFGDKNELLKKRVLGIQSIKEPSITGKLILNSLLFEEPNESIFTIDVKKVTDLKLSVNNLGSMRKK